MGPRHGRAAGTARRRTPAGSTASRSAPTARRSPPAAPTARSGCGTPPRGRQLARLTGHTGRVNSVAFSPTARRSPPAAPTTTVRLWDAATGERARPPRPAIPSAVDSVAFSPDGKTLASGGNDRTVRLWDAATRRAAATASPATPTGSTASRSAPTARRSPPPVAMRRSASGTSPRGSAARPLHRPHRLGQQRRVQPRRQDARLRRRRQHGPALGPRHRQAARAPHRPHRQVFAVAFSPDGKTLASAGPDTRSASGTPPTGEQPARLTGHATGVRGVAFSPDGKTARLRERRYDGPALGSRHAQAARAAHRPHRLRSTASRSALTARRSPPPVATKTIRLWNPATGEAAAPLRRPHRHGLRCRVQPRRQDARLRRFRHAVRLWNPVNGKQLAPLTGHTDRVNSVAFSPDGKTLASGSADNAVRLWDLATGKRLAPLTGHTGSVVRCRVQPRRQDPRLRQLRQHGPPLGPRPRASSSPASPATPTGSTASRSAPTARRSPPPAPTRRSASGTPPRASSPRRLTGHTGNGLRRRVQPRRQDARLRQLRPHRPPLERDLLAQLGRAARDRLRRSSHGPQPIGVGPVRGRDPLPPELPVSAGRRSRSRGFAPITCVSSQRRQSTLRARRRRVPARGRERLPPSDVRLVPLDRARLQ